MRKICILVLAAALFSGCAKRQPAPVQPVENPAETALSRAAEEIQRDLRMLADDNYKGERPAGIEALTASTSYRFTGELEDLVKDVARRIGYKTEFTGRIPSQAIIVTIYSVDPISWFHILQSAGTQAGDRADLIVNAQTRTLAVAYAGIGQPKKQNGNRSGEKTAAARKNNLLVHRGDVSGAHKKIAEGLGYKTKVIGKKKAIPVNIASGKRSWEEIVRVLNEHMADGKITIDDRSETVILKYEK